jgi:hypothetical protein
MAYLAGAALTKVFSTSSIRFPVLTDKVLMTTVLGTSFRRRMPGGNRRCGMQVHGAVRVSQRRTTKRPSQHRRDAAQPTGRVAARQQLRRELVAQPVQLAPQTFVTGP